MSELLNVDAVPFQPHQPSRTHFERRLKRLERDILRMGALVENSFRLSHQALFARNLSAAEELPLLDKQIDQFYRHVEIECAALLTLEAPVAKDLRLLSAFMQLVRDLERIGDYAEDLGEIAIKLFPYPPHQCIPQIEIMSHHAQAMLAASLMALADLDAQAGLAVKQLDDVVDDSYENLYHTLATERDIQGVLEPWLLLALVIRHLERMADHATNVGQRVAYIVTGQRS
ncbi:MAG: Phosphate-specific transport system accessory protein PhoU [Chroococcidiopsis cubana SAG 39.79]|uniref:Phosphate-specific transport system accessory protein PhoU n=3 Tax=Chroococcidiopsis TaxID=54298 RepID=K9TWL3_CHRTP|nr:MULTISPECIES: phosphate signaling complex protein PhoU [Chroococcidiopsis]AFY86960.1 phosphate uptake regulator, PhoU [Chroococcidiopsis thermalis PCC 7203]MDZ4874257.1 Phosphate-specific transport system accessory protein PhoU [Chroococcidiopsis cubana SAG 39.79]RUT13854.1 phosphate transport system regulatory protein PhoU [Chroococcidiopsis cubana SAG 39.79]URD51821.1 phosphate signaling complex protein PhoU [Chroococcidiopsis sp. CCNUC1]